MSFEQTVKVPTERVGVIIGRDGATEKSLEEDTKAFRAGRAEILVATDTASRGIDVSQVACVVNYDIPVDSRTYFHRVGRTARAGRSGRAFSLVSEQEPADFARILKLTNAPMLPMRTGDSLLSLEPPGPGTRNSGRRMSGGHNGRSRRPRTRARFG
jgi:superfamily II DNA/RNA helicase